jgi:hypothetical protein
MDQHLESVSFEDLPNAGRANARLVEGDVNGKVGAAAGGEIVQHVYGVSELPKRIDDVRSNKPGAAGDEDIHKSRAEIERK